MAHIKYLNIIDTTQFYEKDGILIECCFFWTIIHTTGKQLAERNMKFLPIIGKKRR